MPEAATTLEDPDEASEADAEDETPTPDADETASDDGDYEMAMADQGDIEDPDGFFDGVDADPETTGSTDESDFFDGTDNGSSGESDDETKSSTPGAVAERANATVGKLGVFGLEEGHQKDALEEEFVELAETVGFGNFTERSMEEHMAADFEDIDPVWGMVGAALILGAAIVYKRPDTDTEQIKAKVSDTLGSLPMMNSDDD